jgi:hypothetical protein
MKASPRAKTVTTTICAFTPELIVFALMIRKGEVSSSAGRERRE